MAKDSGVSTAVEDYLKQLYFLQGGLRTEQVVGTGEVAKAMEVSPPSATAMVRRLAREGLVAHEPYRGVRLTEEGYREAVGIIRKHRLVESLLHQVLGMDWTEVHAEAELLEHAVSDKVLEHIDRYLGFPASDPHGDPIPHVDGTLRQDASRRLSACQPEERVTLARVTRQDARFLRYLAQRGLTPGAPLQVLEADSEAGILVLQVGESEPISLSAAAASTLLVQ